MRESREHAELVKGFAEANGCSLRTAQRHRKQQSPEWRTWTEGVATGRVRQGPEDPPPAEEDEGMFDGSGPAVSSLEQAREVARRAYQAYQRALDTKPPRMDTVNQLHKLWREAAEALRKWEQSQLTLGKAQGDLVPMEEVAQAQIQLHTTLASGVMGALTKVAELCGPTMAPEERRRICTQIRDRLFQGITKEALVEGELALG